MAVNIHNSIFVLLVCFFTCVESFSIRAAVYQTICHPSSDTSLENPLAILTQVADSLRVASLHGIDVVIYPELFLTGGHSSQQSAIDRQDTKFNIIGNICEELNVSCIIGYAESIHESELKSTSNIDDDKQAFNSIMTFNADGSRAGNYRSISKQDFSRSGHAFVESTPMLLQLPNRDTSNGEDREREIKVGLMCGGDVSCPQHCMNLVSSGAQILVASTSFTKPDTRVVECVLPTRALENQVPFLFANYESQEEKINEGDLEFRGSSAIISKDGEYLVRAPQHEGGIMPSDCGYLIPCDEVGTLYAADINVESTSNTESNDQWELKARMPDELLGQQSNKKQAIGFGNVGSSSKRKRQRS